MPRRGATVNNIDVTFLSGAWTLSLWQTVDGLVRAMSAVDIISAITQCSASGSSSSSSAATTTESRYAQISGQFARARHWWFDFMHARDVYTQ